ncbi:hypothetical protein CORT_0B08450 [Candida orthopsilosis Co 90-125]|uniref:AN1-type domain-containing protein n=1 Tax=Candida orthopsilosis (strain 90-125) TaxID=1136231 RepID=H8X038_CANO9|nr:hypothetical protein CORT_0B08450 [Candida orthopsilosis Co 90-125]CCG22550.1 hypothetical protein CORT_0B08450 [Candida orthopsilosis Co 90-125]
MSSVANLFIDKKQAPPHEDQGIMDIGKNCSYCNQLDFLPFTCEFCKKTYCSNHRTLEQHHCPHKDKFYNQPPKLDDTLSSISSSTTVSSKSLFPDREADRKLIDARLKSPEPTTIKETQFRVGDVAGSNAFKKFQKFLNIQKDRKSRTGGDGGSISRLFGKKSSTTTTSKYADMARLKKYAQGDAKIPLSDRIYIWCVYVKDPNICMNIEQDKKPVYISKNWVIGKSLDSIAEKSRIPNINNSTTKADERLNIFKIDEVKNDEPRLVKNSDKSSILKNGDIIYLVRGVI